MKAIFSRRSIRKYTDQPVAPEDINDLLAAAMNAPSAGNEQPWHFIIITERSILDEIPKVHPYANMLKEAPVAILVCGDEQKEKYKGFWVQDCAAATQNILLAVADKGLGAVWVGVYPLSDRVNALRKLVGAPDHIIPFALIPVGYPAESKESVNRYNAERVHYNRWQ